MDGGLSSLVASGDREARKTRAERPAHPLISLALRPDATLRPVVGDEAEFQRRGVFGEAPGLPALGEFRVGDDRELVVSGALPRGEADLMRRALLEVRLGIDARGEFAAGKPDTVGVRHEGAERDVALIAAFIERLAR